MQLRKSKNKQNISVSNLKEINKSTISVLHFKLVDEVIINACTNLNTVQLVQVKPRMNAKLRRGRMQSRAAGSVL